MNRYERSASVEETCVNGTQLLLENGTYFENGTCANATTTSSTHHEDSRAPAILFMFGVCALGAFIRTVFKRAPLPYTVILLILGTLFGALSGQVDGIKEFTGMASMDPHIILHSFLPVLIFESAFAIESHSFLKASVQIILLAVPGLVLASLLTAVFSMYVFDYGWDIYTAMMFGAIVSATDPVAVVALLKELGVSKHLGLIIEGESLLNDGAAIVVFNVFKKLATLKEGEEAGIDKMVGSFFWVALIGPLFGWIMAKITIIWLVNIFNDALTEITITLSITYLTFYIGEEFLQVSGVLAVVALGLCLSAERTSISPEVEKFLHRFWEMLAYLANTLIFFLVGVVITEKAIQGVDTGDWVLILALYCVINVIRALVIALLSPLLNLCGASVCWKSATVMSWGGLRGAVSLALALMVYEEDALDDPNAVPTNVLQSKVLLHTAGIVMLTLLINATTVGKLLKLLGMSEISVAKRVSMGTALRRLEDVCHKSINTFKSDRFLADSDWVVVEEKIHMVNPYTEVADAEADIEELTNLEDRHNTCPSCDVKFPCEPSKKEYEEMMYEARMRLLKGQKTSYWKQFEQGMLSREAVRKLMEVVDVATDKEDGYIDISEIKKTWLVKKFWTTLKAKLEKWKKAKHEVDSLPIPENKHLKKVFDFCSHEAFELAIYAVVFMNIIMIFIEFGLESELRCDGPLKMGFNIVNYLFIVIYVLEALLKILAFRKYYFKNHWNNFDLVILALSFVDVALDETIFAPTGDCLGAVGKSAFNPNVLKLAKIAKIMRLLRILRGLKTVRALIPQLLRTVNGRINIALRFGYDVGKGYVMGEEDVFLHIPLMVDNKEIALELREKVNQGRIEIMRELGLLQKEHPGIAVSVKTQQATRRILNTLRDKISLLRGEGVLDELESHKIELMVEKKMKKLLKMPATMPPPPPERVIGNLPWIKGDKLLMEYITDNAELVSMQEGETLFCEGDPQGGIYIIVSGLIKVDGSIIDLTATYSELDQSDTTESQSSILDNADRIFDYLTTGSVIGEVSLLTNQCRRANISCETSTQLYHIGYEAIQSALELFTDPPSLEYKLWHVCALRLAAGIMKRHYTYKIWPIERIKIYLEKSTMYLHHYDTDDYHYGSYTGALTTFEIKPLLMSDVILIHGACLSTTMGHKYTGPCYIPLVADVLSFTSTSDRHVLLILPRGSSIGLTTVSDKQGNQSVTTLPRKNTSLCLRHSSLLRTQLSSVMKSRMGLVENHILRAESADPSNTGAQSRRASMFAGLGRQSSGNLLNTIHSGSNRASPMPSTLLHQNHSYASCEITSDKTFFEKTLNIPSDIETGNSQVKRNKVHAENVSGSSALERMGKLPPLPGALPNPNYRPLTPGFIDYMRPESTTPSLPPVEDPR